MIYSFWEKKFIESSTDVIILGSGIVGLSTALSIKEMNPLLSVKVIERGSMPYGASTKNAGFSCFGSISELLDDFNSIGEKACMEIVNMRWKGLQKLKSRVGYLNLEYQDCGGYELFRLSDDQTMEECIGKLAYCNELMLDTLGIKECYEIAENQNLSGFHKTCIFNSYEGSINPISMMNTLISMAYRQGIQIINGIEIQQIDFENQTLITNSDFKIQYQKLIICTNGFAAQLMPELEVKPARNQVLMTKPISNLNLNATFHVDKGYLYFRQYEGRILLGGGRNQDAITETTSDFGNTELIQTYLKSVLEMIHPGGSSLIDHWWSGIMGVGDSKNPIFKWHDQNVLLGVRLGGMGVAIGSYLGEQLAKEIIEKVN